jgi:hypothetical protein
MGDIAQQVTVRRVVVRLEVLTIKITAPCKVKPYSLVEINQRFKETYVLYHQYSMVVGNQKIEAAESS